MGRANPLATACATHYRRLVGEQLDGVYRSSEQRMTDRTWVAGVAGDWLAPGNWLPDGVPQPGDQLTIVSGAPTISQGAITAETIRLLGSVTLNVVSVTFKPGPDGPAIISVRGAVETPTEATILSKGTTSFTGKILVEAVGGGSLTILSAGDGSTGNFILGENGLILVTQESLISFAGIRVTNNGLVQVEGVASIESGVDFLGKGIIEIDSGGKLSVDGTLGAGQKLLLADGTGDVAIGDVDLFHARVGLTDYGGNRFFLGDVSAKSASYEDGELTLYRHKNQKGAIEAELSVALINPASLTWQPRSEQTLSAKDFAFAPDGSGGTVMTYAPRGPTYLEASLPVPIVAETGSTVSLKVLLKQAFGAKKADFDGMTLLPAKPLDGTGDFWGQVAFNGIDPVRSGWIVNGEAITEATKVRRGDEVSFLVGNSIAFPPELRVQVTETSKGRNAEYVDYSLWAVDPAVVELVRAPGYTPGKPLPADVVTSAESFQHVYGRVFNTELCNWIADNVAAAGGAPMPLPDQFLEPGSNVEGGFWRIAYRGSDSESPVIDWNTLVQPGDIVRLEWATTGAGHTTTVLAVSQDGTLEVYDNIDVIDGEHHIGSHDDVAYWKKTDPAGITIYRLDPNGQYLIDGTKRAERLQGSVFDDLIHGQRGADRLVGSIGNDELHGDRGRDVLRGGAGDDLLFGGKLQDKLSGGPGANIFAYTSIAQSKPAASLRDTILSFANDRDRIDLSAIDVKLAAEGKQPLHFIGEVEFTGEPGELIYIGSGDFVVVEADLNGDAVADFAIKVMGTANLGAGDFIL